MGLEWNKRSCFFPPSLSFQSHSSGSGIKADLGMFGDSSHFPLQPFSIPVFSLLPFVFLASNFFEESKDPPCLQTLGLCLCAQS